MLTPDMNACYLGNLRALAAMARMLGLPVEADVWEKKAEDVRRRMFEYLWDEEDQYFYDVDRHGRKRRIRSISITNVFSERVFDADLGNAVFDRYIANPAHFWTPYPMPAVAISDPTWVQKLDGNSWGFYSQGLTALRSMRWMPAYGREAEMEELMRRWVSAWSHSETTPFGQELHPITGQPSKCAPWYSSCMLYFLHAIRRLYDIEQFAQLAMNRSFENCD